MVRGKGEKKEDEDGDFLTSELCGNEFQTVLERSWVKRFGSFSVFPPVFELPAGDLVWR